MPSIDTRSSGFFPLFVVSGSPAGRAALASLDNTRDIRDGGEATPDGLVWLTSHRGFRLQGLSNGAANDTYKVDIELVELVDFLNPRPGIATPRPIWEFRLYSTLTLTVGAATGRSGGVVESGEKYAKTIAKVNTAYGDYVDAGTGKELLFYNAADVVAEAQLVDVGNHHVMRLRPHTYGGAVTLVQLLVSLDT